MKILRFNELIEENNKRKILIVDSHANYNSIVVNCKNPVKNIEAKTILEIAEFLLNKKIAQNGEIRKIKIIDDEVSSSIIFSILTEKADKYIRYIRSSSVDYTTSREIYKQIKILLNSFHTKKFEYDITNDQTKLYFVNELAKDYLEKIAYLNLYDEYTLLNESNGLFDFDNIYIEETCYKKLTYLERQFLNINTKELPLVTFLNTKDNNKYNMYSVYGNYNEVDNATSIVIDNKLELGATSFIYTSNTFIAYLQSILEIKEIPYYFTNRPIVDSEVYELFCSICSWINSSYDIKELEPFGIKCYGLTEGFNLLVKLNFTYGLAQYQRFVDGMTKNKEAYLNFYVKKMELINETYKDYIVKDDNDSFMNIINFVNSLVYLAELNTYQTFYIKALSLIKKYINNSKKNNLILSTLFDDNSFYEYVLDTKDKMLFTNFMLNRIKSLTYKENENQGAIELKKFTSFDVNTRKNIFIMGLSFDDFEISSQDSPILNDKDKSLYYDEKAGYIEFDRNKGAEKRDSFYLSLLALTNANVYLSYSSFDTNQKRYSSYSIVYHEILEKYNLNENTIDEYKEQINNNYTFTKLNADNYDNKIYKLNNLDYKEENNGHIIRKIFVYASSLETIDKCYLEYLYQQQEERKYCSYRKNDWLNSQVKGTFCHKVLECYAKEVLIDKKINSQEIDSLMFNKIFETIIEQYKLVYPAISDSIIEREEKKYKNILLNYLQNLYADLLKTGYIVGGVEDKEKDIVVASLNENGEMFDLNKDKIEYQLVITGKYDRYDYKVKDGKKIYRIIDYKTTKDDKTESKQYLIYPHMKKFMDGKEISFVYQFILFNNSEKTISYDAIKNEEAYCGEVLKKIIKYPNEFIMNESECKNCYQKNKCIKYFGM